MRLGRHSAALFFVSGSTLNVRRAARRSHGYRLPNLQMPSARSFPHRRRNRLHGDFKVADTVFAEEEGVEYTREEWEAALDKAKERMEPGEQEENWPLIVTDDFY